MNNFKRYASIAAAAVVLAGFSGAAAAHADETTTTTTTDDFTSILVTVNHDTPIYYEPGAQIPTEDHLAAGQHWYVVGVDATRKFARVEVTEQFFTWVPVSSLALGDVSKLPVVVG
jgi:hypothetical protein